MTATPPAPQPAFVPSSPRISAQMSAARSEDTAPEKALRSELHKRGLRFRLHRPLSFDKRRRADIVFGVARVAVFVDGCFWHSCPEHATWPKTNADWWRSKLERNKERDLETNQRLRDLGWEPIRIWEHEDPVVAADRVESIVRARTRGKRA